MVKKQALVLNFPFSRALALHSSLFSKENEFMTPANLFENALQRRSYTEAIRILSSVRQLQTEKNMMSCAVTPQLAFDLLRHVTASRKLIALINLAAQEVRYARLIVEDMPEFRTDSLLVKAIDGDLSWASKYRDLFGISDSKLKKLISANLNSKKRDLKEGLL